MIKYVKGNVLDIQPEKQTLIIHVCNDAGGFGSGFAGAIKNKYPIVREKYLEWYNGLDSSYPRLKLGQIQFVEVDKNLTFCNMIAQSRPGGREFYIKGETIHLPPIRYECLEECLWAVKEATQNEEIDIVGPKFGAGLAGGNWYEIEKRISVVGLDITIWELE
jgi:hypothetical protein